MLLLILIAVFNNINSLPLLTRNLKKPLNLLETGPPKTHPSIVTWHMHMRIPILLSSFKISINSSMNDLVDSVKIAFNSLKKITLVAKEVFIVYFKNEAEIISVNV